MPARILEISHLPWVKMALPEETDHVDTTFFMLPGSGILGKLRAAGSQILRLCRLSLQAPSEVIFCRCLGRFVYRRELGMPVNFLRWFMRNLIRLCVIVQVRRGARLAVVDQLDESTIDAADFSLLRLAACYFKRELPQNAWNVFLRVQPANGEFIDLTRDGRYVPHLHKFQPVSIGITSPKIRLIEQAVADLPDDEKDLDVFFAGPLTHSTVRTHGFRQLEELGRRGFRIDVSEGGLPFEEFVRRMRRSWLVWSPEGQGWDCYRHYEICVAGSVPLMNYPAIRRHRPLLDGQHCVFYAVEGDDLCRQVERSLADHEALRRMATAARAHVLSFHTDERQGLYMANHLLPGAIPVENSPAFS